MTNGSSDLYTRITEKILADLERGVRPWIKPWSTGSAAGPITRPLRHNGVPYRGINVLLLWGTAIDKGYTQPFWMTFRQAKQLGGHVRKGETGSLVVYADRIDRTETGDDGEETVRQIPFLKAYNVFNVEQIDNLPAHYAAEPVELPIEPGQRDAALDRFFAATGVEIRHGGDHAFYAIGPDYVQMPPFASFQNGESYFVTLAHEIVHSTRHPSRLDRDLGRKQWGDEGYSREELVAEIGSAFLAADLNITPEVREDHAAYLADWLTVLKGDKRCIVTAAAHAQKAVDYLHRLVETAALAPAAAETLAA